MFDDQVITILIVSRNQQVRELKAGDYLWILLPPNVHPDDEEIRPNAEEVLPFIVERKTWDDLQDTLRTNRFDNQVDKMIVCISC